MSWFDNFVDKEKVSKVSIANPREVFYNILKQTSGSSKVRSLAYAIFYQIIAFRGVSDGIGTSTLVANTALALAELGLTVCVIDTSILNPVQDVLLKTSEASVSEGDGVNHLDWFDMPYTRNSTLHVSKINKNVSVLSFKGKPHGVVDMLSTSDSPELVSIALTELHNKFDLILIDTCQELTEINIAAIQSAQRIIQVWNDSPTVLANLENFISNSITISCPLDKMRSVVYSRIVKDAMGSIDPLLQQYRLKNIAKSYMSEEIAMLLVTGKTLWQYPSTNQLVIDYTNCIVDIVCHILNIEDDTGKPKGTITSNDIMDGKVEGTLNKKMKDFNETAPKVEVNLNPMVNNPMDANGDGIVDDRELTEALSGEVEVSSDESYATTLESDTPEPSADTGKKKKKLFGRGKK